MGNNYLLTKIQSDAFTIILIITWVLYFVIALGLSVKAPEYLDNLQYYVKLYVSLFLIWRFNPFRRVKFTFLDARIGFSAGVFLLMTTFVGNLLNTYLTQVQNIVKALHT
jgi:hypothetical protein